MIEKALLKTLNYCYLFGMDNVTYKIYNSFVRIYLTDYGLNFTLNKEKVLTTEPQELALEIVNKYSLGGLQYGLISNKRKCDT